ncbi:MAG: hypothetical protein Q8P18_27045 [Pseudomonadota bacterium]|nr:hypothetical protein [Pseudomonadota bacterium]
MPTPFNPLAPPDEAYWVGELRVGRFNELGRLVREGVVAVEFDRLWSRSAERAVARSLIEAWGSEHGHAHLMLLAWFAEEKSYRAIESACRRALPDPLRATYLVGAQRRLAALAALLQHAPANLADVYYWDAWLPRSRAAMKMQGHQRRLPRPLAEVSWDSLAAEGLHQARLPASAVEGLRFERALARDWLDDALLVFRSHGTSSVQWDPEEDRPRAMSKEDLTFLRFHARGARVDITTRDMDRALPLASAIGTLLFGVEVQFRHARDPLNRERLDAFLERLLDADDPAFQLHEIVGTTAAHADPALITLHRGGRGRVEELAQAQRRQFGFARDSRHVDRVKISFTDEGEHYRMALFFPEPQDEEKDLALSLADTSTNKDTVDRFRAKMLNELGVEIHPKVADARRRRRQQGGEPRPRPLKAAHYTALLSGRIDAPAEWQLDELADLAARGLVGVVHESVFRCGDTSVPALFRPAGSLHCTGEVTAPFGAVSNEDGFTQEPGSRVVCDHGHEWSLDRVRPAWFRRVRVQVLVPAATAWLRGELTASRWEEDEPGVFSKLVRGYGRRAIAVLEAAPLIWHTPNAPRSCWAALDPGTDTGVLHPVISLAALLADGIRAIPQAGVEAPVRPEEPGEDLWLEPDATGGIRRGTITILGPQMPRFRLLFALLQEWGEKHGWTTLAKRTDLCDLDESRTLTPDSIARLLHGLDREIGKASVAVLFDNQGRSGLRLRAPLRARGFHLDDELDRLKGRSRPRPEN